MGWYKNNRTYIGGCYKEIHNRHIHMDPHSHKIELVLDI